MTLYITEKPSQVQKLEAALEAENIKDYSIDPLVGHIMRAWEPKEYPDGIKNWNTDYKNGKIPYVPDEWKKSVDADKTDIFSRVRKGIEKADKIILATDPDNEGVVLGMEVLEILKAEHKLIGMINMNKLDLASLRKEVHIINKIPYKEMNEAGNTRYKGDWIFGMNGTVGATVVLGNSIEGEKKTINVGGVKSSVMRMVVERDEQFEKFKNIPFWEIKGIIEKDGKEFEVSFTYNNEERFEKEEKAKEILDQMKKEGTITDYKEETKTKAPNLPLSLGNLQSLVETKHKIKGDKVLEIAQSLYDKTYQSYPRTDNNYYSDGEYQEVPNIMNNLKKVNPTFSKIIDNMKLPYMKRNIFDDKKVSAHTALSPTSVFPSNITDFENKVYSVTVSRYLEQFLDDYKYISINGEGKTNVPTLIFKFKNNVSINLGWKIVGMELFGEKDTDSIRTIPQLTKGETLPFKKVWLHKGETKAKPRFTYKALKEAMEKVETIYDDAEIKKHLKDTGIGTPSTRDAIITEIFKGGFFVYDKAQKYIISTPKTRTIINLLPKDMTSPVFRAKFEENLKLIVAGKRKEKEVLDEIILALKHFFKEMEQIAIDKNIAISGSYTKVEKEDTKLPCPICKKGTILKSGKAYGCSLRIFNPKTKKNSGCSFGFLIEHKPIEKIITDEEFTKLLNGGSIEGKDGNKLLMDLSNPPFFSKIEWANSNNNVTPSNKTDTNVKCPKCSKGSIIETDILFKCSDSKYDSKTKKSSGCQFQVWKNQTKFLDKTFTLSDINSLIKNGEIEGNEIKGQINKLVINKNEVSGVKLEFGKK
jgi:DNA topoisomerase-3